jgi:hypothetical protein
MSSPEGNSNDLIAQKQIESLNLSPLDLELTNRAFHLNYLNTKDLFSIKFMETYLSRAKVGIHEAGHEVVGAANGWIRIATTVIEKGRVLGSTLSTPGGPLPLIQGLKERARLSFGSLFSEVIGGISDHSGTGGDNGNIRALGMAWERFTGGSSSAFISEQRSIASAQASSRGRGYYLDRGLFLASVGTDA